MFDIIIKNKLSVKQKYLYGIKNIEFHYKTEQRFPNTNISSDAFVKQKHVLGIHIFT